ncbi:MAG: hypothetical protein WBE76_19890 [Terracidiphilus sp.]
MSTNPVTPNPGPEIKAYLPRLYLESRQMLFRILLDEAIPQSDLVSADSDETADILRRIEALIASDEHLDGCRKKILEKLPGRLAVMFNLAGKNDKLFPNDVLRESIRNHVRRHQLSVAGGPLDSEDLGAMEELKRSSKLQQQLAYLVNYTPNKWLLEQEIPVILESRKRRLNDARAEVPAGSQGPTVPPVSPPAEAQSGGFSDKKDPHAWSRDIGRLSGLCLSGGGIRSATFNLGILQGLAQKNLLRRFDYLSSVSGGGYIHQWFAAWVKREEAQHTAAAGSPGLDAVCRQMIPLPNPGCAPVTPQPIRWLRQYSNYLTPQTGLLSADTWVTFAIWVRNTFLNQIVLVSFLLLVLLGPHLFLLPGPALPKISSTQPVAAIAHSGFEIALAVVIIVAVLSNYLLLVRSLVAGLRDARKGQSCDSRLSDKSLCWSVVMPSLVIAIFVSDFGFYFIPFGLDPIHQATYLCIAGFAGLFILNVAVTAAGGAMDKRPGVDDPQFLRVIFFTLTAALAALAATGALLLERNTFVTGNPAHFYPAAPQASPAAADPRVSVKVSTGDSQQINVQMQVTKAPAESRPASHPLHEEVEMQWRLVVAFGPLALMSVLFLAVILQCGLIGYKIADWVLEWLARLRAWVALYSLAWTLLVGISLFGHQLVEMMIRQGNSWINWTAVGSWLLTTAGSVLSGKSSSSSGEPGSKGSSRTMNFLIAVGPPVYILGLLLMLSWAVQEALFAVGIAGGSMSVRHLSAMLSIVVLVPLGTFLLFGWRVDINEFSMHSYYRNRLARCYLGASNTMRDPDPLTGFDKADVEGLRLSTFLPSQGYTGPLPVFCAALNISVGEDLAWQERKAASFVFSPVLSGYHIPWTGRRYSGQLSYNGFVPTDRFAYPNGGINVSTAAAISGAAISPNWGYHTSPPMAFLLTMFNVRLGWWLPNPRRSFLAFDPNGEPPRRGARFPRAKFAPKQLLRELLGQIGDDRGFVYLTDGGHFDNMGLYELVRRRCYEIVICDAEEDTGPVFEGIGMAIRKCRIDFGVEIELDLNQLATDAVTKVSKVHWILGSIKYPETGTAEPGTILYIKSSITGKEAADIYNYRLQHTPFPQDSTMDQWFTESKFESYRRLGQQVVDQCPYFPQPEEKD